MHTITLLLYLTSAISAAPVALDTRNPSLVGSIGVNVGLGSANDINGLGVTSNSEAINFKLDGNVQAARAR